MEPASAPHLLYDKPYFVVAKYSACTVVYLSAGQTEEPQPAIAAAVCTTSHARFDCIHSKRLRGHGQLQPSKDSVDNADAQPWQRKWHYAGLWAVEEKPMQQRCLGVLTVLTITR